MNPAWNYSFSQICYPVYTMPARNQPCSNEHASTSESPEYEFLLRVSWRYDVIACKMNVMFICIAKLHNVRMWNRDEKRILNFCKVRWTMLQVTRDSVNRVWIFAGCKRYEIVPYSGVYTMPYSNQSSRRTVFISYRIQMIFMPVSCRRKANPVFFHTVFVSYRHRVNGVLVSQ